MKPKQTQLDHTNLDQLLYLFILLLIFISNIVPMIARDDDKVHSPVTEVEAKEEEGEEISCAAVQIHLEQTQVCL